MNIKADWSEPCPNCGAAGSCCIASLSRRETADDLAKLVERQSKMIDDLKASLDDARELLLCLRGGGDEKIPTDDAPTSSDDRV